MESITLNAQECMELIELSIRRGKYDNARAILEDMIKSYQQVSSEATPPQA